MGESGAPYTLQGLPKAEETALDSRLDLGLAVGRLGTWALWRLGA
jgi:hypothetical protein